MILGHGLSTRRRALAYTKREYLEILHRGPGPSEANVLRNLGRESSWPLQIAMDFVDKFFCSGPRSEDSHCIK